MNEQIKSYIKAESAISAAFNFFINGMIAALIYHKADAVATDAVSIAADLLITCVSIGVLTALFSKASVKRAKTAGMLETDHKVTRLMSRLFRHPVLFGVFAGITAAVILYIPTALLFMLPGILSMPFGFYVVLKSMFAALMGRVFTALELYAGMCKAKP
jgi:protein-S-isoprenylcysteine O-methyltransferase Ste14